MTRLSEVSRNIGRDNSESDILGISPSFQNLEKEMKDEWHSKGHRLDSSVNRYMHMMCTLNLTELLSDRQKQQEENTFSPTTFDERRKVTVQRTLDVNYWTTSDSGMFAYSLHKETLKKGLQGHTHKQIPVCLYLQHLHIPHIITKLFYLILKTTVCDILVP